jgi:hypothetical protein
MWWTGVFPLHGRLGWHSSRAGAFVGWGAGPSMKADECCGPRLQARDTAGHPNAVQGRWVRVQVLFAKIVPVHSRVHISLTVAFLVFVQS